MNKKDERLKWQAESDASVMAQYQEILGDTARMNRAIKVAKRQAEDLQKRVSMMQRVSSSRASKKK